MKVVPAEGHATTRAGAAGLFALLACLGCSTAVEVFGPAPTYGPTDGSVRDPDDGLTAQSDAGPRREDAGAAPEDAGAAPEDAGPPPATDAGASACGQCPPPSLCAVDHCTDVSGVSGLSGSLDFTCVVLGGQLYCWGLNDNGQLGSGDKLARDRPARVGSWNDWLKIGTGEQHACAIRAPGQLYCWGQNSAGQLGLGDTEGHVRPARVGTRQDWVSVACGGENCCAIDAAATLHCWGSNHEGKPGLADAYGSPDVLEPTPVASDHGFEDVAVGQGHTCAIRQDGALLCWGRSGRGELGTGDEREQVRDLVMVGEGKDWVDIAAAQHHTCGVRANGTLHCWGYNENLELTDAGAMIERQPVAIGGEDWAAVATGWFHTCGVKRDGSLHCWGRAIEGQVGAGSRLDPEPQPVAVELPAKVRSLSAGRFSTCAADELGTLYCWGENVGGQLGLGDYMRRHSPAVVIDAEAI